MEKLAKFLNDLKPLCILDVGTGGGNFIKLLDNLYDDYDKIIGIDTIENAIKAANKNFENNDKISFIQMDALDMTFDDNSFDLICLSNSLHHLVDLKTPIDEMTRVLKPGGYLLFAEMINNDLNEQQTSHMLVHHFAAKLDRLRGNTHNDTYSDKTILSLLNEQAPLSVSNHWLMEYEERGENTDEEINWFTKTVDQLVNRFDDENIKKEGEEIKDYIRKHGFDSCPTLMVVMKK